MIIIDFDLLKEEYCFQTIDYQDPSKNKQQQDLLTNEQNQIDDLDVFLVGDYICMRHYIS